VSFNLILQSQYSLFNRTWQKRRRELDNQLSFEIAETILQIKKAVESQKRFFFLINFIGRKSSRTPHGCQIWNQQSNRFKFYYITQLSYKWMFHFYCASAINLANPKRDIYSTKRWGSRYCEITSFRILDPLEQCNTCIWRAPFQPKIEIALRRSWDCLGWLYWWCFYYFLTNSLVALLEALCARLSLIMGVLSLKNYNPF